MIGPMLFSFVWNHSLMNRVLRAGVLADVHLLGTPTLILAHTAVAAVLVLVFGRELVGAEYRSEHKDTKTFVSLCSPDS